ncbi:MAG: hypothetical protein JO086_17140 [Acidimicrobiia bacterium]|nr:hypothetical protein [Acidimicrobiia bacterium]
MKKRLIGFAAGAALLGAAAIPVSSAFAQTTSRNCGNYELGSVLSQFQNQGRVGFAQNLNNNSNNNPNLNKANGARGGQQTVAGFVVCGP